MAWIVSKPKKHLHKMKIADQEGYLKEWATSSQGHSTIEVASIVHILGKSIYATLLQMHKFCHFLKKQK